ncbi:MAG TPA: hypothetical protein O0X70_06835 [Methanocorpusculum sp.]|nr:hypothetical protein [Methanocorpusculum sp.]
MKKIVLAAGIFVALIAVVAVAGCVASDPIVGTWESKSGVSVLGVDLATSSLTFNADGTGSSTGSIAIFSADTTFNWKKVSDGKYAITYGSSDPKEISVTFTSDGKSMTYNGTTYTRKA